MSGMSPSFPGAIKGTINSQGLPSSENYGGWHMMQGALLSPTGKECGSGFSHLFLF